MKIFLDTADIRDIKYYTAMGLVDGVTTNPTLIAKEGRNFETVIKEIADIVDGPVSAEITNLDVKGMVQQATEIAKWAKNVVVKIPMTESGLVAVKKLSAMNIKTNVTLIFTVSQGLLAAKAGATYISPFIGRLDDVGLDGIELVKNLRIILDNYKLSTEIISASIRDKAHVEAVGLAGSDIATIPPVVFKKLWVDPLTEKGIKQFMIDWSNFKKDHTKQ